MRDDVNEMDRNERQRIIGTTEWKKLELEIRTLVASVKGCIPLDRIESDYSDLHSGKPLNWTPYGESLMEVLCLMESVVVMPRKAAVEFCGITLQEDSSCTVDPESHVVIPISKDSNGHLKRLLEKQRNDTCIKRFGGTVAGAVEWNKAEREREHRRKMEEYQLDNSSVSDPPSKASQVVKISDSAAAIQTSSGTNSNDTSNGPISNANVGNSQNTQRGGKRSKTGQSGKFYKQPYAYAQSVIEPSYRRKPQNNQPPQAVDHNLAANDGHKNLPPAQNDRITWQRPMTDVASATTGQTSQKTSKNGAQNRSTVVESWPKIPSSAMFKNFRISTLADKLIPPEFTMEIQKLRFDKEMSYLDRLLTVIRHYAPDRQCWVLADDVPELYKHCFGTVFHPRSANASDIRTVCAYLQESVDHWFDAINGMRVCFRPCRRPVDRLKIWHTIATKLPKCQLSQVAFPMRSKDAHWQELNAEIFEQFTTILPPVPAQLRPNDSKAEISPTTRCKIYWVMLCHFPLEGLAFSQLSQAYDERYNTSISSKELTCVQIQLSDLLFFHKRAPTVNVMYVRTNVVEISDVILDHLGLDKAALEKATNRIAAWESAALGHLSTPAQAISTSSSLNLNQLKELAEKVLEGKPNGMAVNSLYEILTTDFNNRSLNFGMNTVLAQIVPPIQRKDVAPQCCWVRLAKYAELPWDQMINTIAAHASNNSGTVLMTKKKTSAVAHDPPTDIASLSENLIDFSSPPRMSPPLHPQPVAASAIDSLLFEPIESVCNTESTIVKKSTNEAAKSYLEQKTNIDVNVNDGSNRPSYSNSNNFAVTLNTLNDFGERRVYSKQQTLVNEEEDTYKDFFNYDEYELVQEERPDLFSDIEFFSEDACDDGQLKEYRKHKPIILVKKANS